MRANISFAFNNATSFAGWFNLIGDLLSDLAL